jgi:prophage regulatory protein
MATQSATVRKPESRANPTYQPFPEDDDALVRLPQVLSVLPIGRTAFLDGVKSGEFPKPCKIGTSSFWRAGDIRRILVEISEGKAACQRFPENDEALARLPQILSAFPIGRAAFLDGVKSGRFPQPIKPGKWKAGEVRRVLAGTRQGAA